MKLSCETSGGTPPGGAIILGRLEGMPLLVAVGEGIVEGSWTMLLGMKSVVSVLVAVGKSVRTGVCELVAVGMTGIGIVAESLADTVVAEGETLADAGGDTDSEGESEAEDVADEDCTPVDTAPEADGVTERDSVAEEATLALLEVATEVETVSEAGMDDGMLRDSLGVTLDDTPVPVGVEDGRMPEDTSDGEREKVGRIPEEVEALSVGVVLSVPVGTGVTEPENVAEGIIPDDRRPDEKSEAMLETMLLSSEVGIGRGIEAVGRTEPELSADSALDTRLDTMLGRAESVGRSETAEDRRLESSETTDGRTDGRMPDAEGVGVIVAVTGAVGSTAPELGTMPEGRTSETTEDRNEGRSNPELAETPSEVGIAPDGETSLVGVADADSVPSAVVMPMIIPLPLVERAPVGTTPLLGRIPDSTAEVGVGSALPRMEDRREPMRPAEELGRTISESGGRTPVDATAVGDA